MLQHISWPTAIVLAVALMVFGFLQYKGIALPPWVAALLFGGGTSMPALVSGKGAQS